MVIKTTLAGVIGLGNVRPESAGVVQGEGVANCKPNGSECAVAGGFGGSVQPHIMLCSHPEGVVVAIRGVKECMFICKRVRCATHTMCLSPFASPFGIHAFPCLVFLMSSGLHPVKGCKGGKVASPEGVCPCC